MITRSPASYASAPDPSYPAQSEEPLWLRPVWPHCFLRLPVTISRTDVTVLIKARKWLGASAITATYIVYAVAGWK